MRNGKKKSRGDIYISWEYPLLSITFRVLRGGWWHEWLLQRRWYHLYWRLSCHHVKKSRWWKNFILAQGLAKLRFACMTAGPNGSLSCNLSLCAPVTIDVSACPSSIFIRVAAAAEKHDFASRSPPVGIVRNGRRCVRTTHAFVVLLSNSVHGMSEPGLG